MSYIVLLGAPGSGKGTQAKRITEATGLPSISTGDLIRKEVADASVIGLKTKSYMDKGLLVPDEIIIELFRLSAIRPENSNGFISDGFPRTVAQAKAFDDLISSISSTENRLVFLFDVTIDLLLERLLGRKICKSCGSIYHNKYNPPSTPNKCDNCSDGILITRSDDTEEVIKERYSVYQETIAPLCDYYGSQVIRIDAAQAQDLVFEQMMSELKIST